MLFDSLGLSDALLRAVRDQGYDRPTPIQQKAIPAVLAGGDLLAGAQTGTGKTAGFVLPLLQRLSARPAPFVAGGRGSRKPVRALIIAPTRELAAQVEASVRLYGKHLKFVSMAMFGGVGFGPQMGQLRRGVDVLVATPGRLLDHQRQGNVDLSRVEILVLDEADRMLDMGFLPDIKQILALLPESRQNLLFSATFSDAIKTLANRLLDRPDVIEVTPRNSTVELRGVTSIVCGPSSSLSASALISSGNVAENSRFCRFAGSSASTRLMSGRKPMSSMRSASSRTNVSTREKLTLPWR